MLEVIHAGTGPGSIARKTGADSSNVGKIGSSGVSRRANIASQVAKLPSPSRFDGVVDFVPVNVVKRSEGNVVTDVVVIYSGKESDLAKSAISGALSGKGYDTVRYVGNRYEVDGTVNANNFISGGRVVGGVLESKSGRLTTANAVKKIAHYKSAAGVLDLSALDEPIVFAQNQRKGGKFADDTVRANGGYYVATEVLGRWGDTAESIAFVNVNHARGPPERMRHIGVSRSDSVAA